MNPRAPICGLLMVSIAHGAVVLSNIMPAPVYVVTRTVSAEARALFSARMLGLNATNLFWYEGANVVRAEVPASAIEQLRGDRDVVLVLPQDQAPPAIQAPPQPAPLMQQPPMPPMQMSPNLMGMGGGVGDLDAVRAHDQRTARLTPCSAGGLHVLCFAKYFSSSSWSRIYRAWRACA